MYCLQWHTQFSAVGTLRYSHTLASSNSTLAPCSWAGVAEGHLQATQKDNKSESCENLHFCFSQLNWFCYVSTVHYMYIRSSHMSFLKFKYLARVKVCNIVN